MRGFLVSRIGGCVRHKLYTVGLVSQSLLYLVAGANHFLHTATYVKIMPPHYGHPALLVQISGAAEIAGAVGLLLPATRRAAAIGIIAMLLVYFDVHFYMATHTAQFAPLPPWTLYARIPLQFVLIAWAAVYAWRPVPLQD